jgi:hypothetical protein
MRWFWKENSGALKPAASGIFQSCDNFCLDKSSS